MSQYTLSMSQNPTLPAWYISEDEGEAWECGDYICFLQKHPPLQMDAMLAMTKRLPTSSIPASETKGFRYLYVLSMFYKKGRNPSGKDSSLPAEVMTIEQVNTAMFSGGSPRWDAPVLCSFKPSGRWNSERRLIEPVSKDAARASFFDELSRRALPSPSKIGNIKEGMDVLNGVIAEPGSRGKTGCLIPLVLTIGSLVAVSIAICFRI